MRPEEIKAWISEARFKNYLDAASGDQACAVQLYNWNAEVSGAFLQVFHHVEVLLRNAVDRQFPDTPRSEPVAIWADAVWLTDPKVLEDEGRERVNDAIRRLTNANRHQTRDRVVAALSFGFWTALFTGRYDELWRSHLRHAFPNGDGRRKQVGKLVQGIGRVRNRVAHHEAIFGYDLWREHEKALGLAGLIDADARAFVEGESRVPDILCRRPD